MLGVGRSLPARRTSNFTMNDLHQQIRVFTPRGHRNDAATSWPREEGKACWMET